MALSRLLEEASIAWAFIHRDITATVVPFSFFTLASSLEAKPPLTAIISNTSKSALLSSMLLYTFTISNQINGVEEDRLNKPDRPIVSGRVSLPAAYIRYTILSLGCILFSYATKAGPGAILFMVFGALHNFTKVSSFGPTKDLATTTILMSGFYSAWKLGGGTPRTGQDWIACLAVNMLFSISIQDLRDVIGDAATGRYTTPWLLGKPWDRIYIAVCMLFTRAATLRMQYLDSSHYYTSIVCAGLVIVADVFLVIRMFRFQDIAEDKKTYRLYMLRFSSELLLSTFILSG